MDFLIYGINYRYLVLYIFYLEIRKYNNNKSINKINIGKVNIYGILNFLFI